MYRRPPSSTRTAPPFPYPPLFRSDQRDRTHQYPREMRSDDGSSGTGRGFLRGNISGYPVEREIVVGKDLFQSVECRCRLAELAWCLTLDRSEEHTSELQSLMRISYAVFCLKKKKK